MPARGAETRNKENDMSITATNFSIYLYSGRLIFSVWHYNILRQYYVTEQTAIAITNRLVRLGFTFKPRLAQFGWVAGRLSV